MIPTTLDTLEQELISTVEYRLIYGIQYPEVLLKDHLIRNDEAGDTKRIAVREYLGDLLTMSEEIIYCSDLATVFNSHAESFSIDVIDQLAPEIAAQMREEFPDHDESFNFDNDNEDGLEYTDDIEEEGLSEIVASKDNEEDDELTGMLIERHPQVIEEDISELPYSIALLRDIDTETCSDIQEKLSLINHAYYLSYAPVIDEDNVDEPGLSEAFREAFLWVESAISDLKNITKEKPDYLIRTQDSFPQKTTAPLGAHFH